MVLSRLLTVGRTVDEAAILYSMLEHACHSQLMADAAAANGVPKKIIDDAAAKFTAEAAQNPVSCGASSYSYGRVDTDISKHNFYTEFQPEYELLVEETNGRFLQ